MPDLRRWFAVAASAAFAIALAAQTRPSPDPDDPGPPVLQRGKAAAKRKAPAPTVEIPKNPKIEPEEAVNAPTAAPASARPAVEGEVRVTETEGETATTVTRPASNDPTMDLIQRAYAAAQEFDNALPAFICDQSTLRYESKKLHPEWKLQDRVELELAYFNRREDYRNVRINGKPLKKGSPEDTGTWSTGDFGTILIAMLATAEGYKKTGSDMIAGEPVESYSYRVKLDRSTWKIQMGAMVKPAHKGVVFINPQSARVMRLEMETISLPPNYPVDKVETTVEYAWFDVGGQKYLLPSRSDNLACFRDTFICTKNEITFKNYRKFSVESTISTTESNINFGDKPEEAPTPGAPAPAAAKPASPKPTTKKKK